MTGKDLFQQSDAYPSLGPFYERYMKGIAAVNETHGHKEVPTGEWVDVEKGYIVAPGTYIDEKGVLREESSGSCVCWHNPGCERRGIQAEDIIYDPSTKAPWCPDCWDANDSKRKWALKRAEQAGIPRNRKARRAKKR